MKHLHAYIVEPIDGRYTNKKNVGDKTLLINTSIEDHKFVNRHGVIKELPVNDIEYLKIGDEVIVHHNVFRRFYDIRGKEKNGMSYFMEDKYLCYLDQIFLYKRNGKWFTPPGFCFVKPVVSEDQFSTENEKPLVGVLKYNNDTLKCMENIQDDDVVGFTPNSEYEFVVDNERLYRVPIKSIAINYGRKTTEVEYNPSWLQSST
jgi:hypothetical protein